MTYSMQVARGHFSRTRLIAIAAILVTGVAATGAAEQRGSTAPAGKPGGACALLPRDVVVKVSGAANKLVFDIPPEEEPVGKSGSACHYADITLQIDALTSQTIDQLGKDKEWVPIPGLGDRSYFRNNRNHFAEVAGRVGTRTFTIQMSVPFQSSAEAIRPNVITLANAIVPKLK